MRRRLQVWMILSLIAVVMPAHAQQAASNKQAAAQSAAADTGAATQKVATQDPKYIIGAQDVLDISVWKEPEVSRLVPVRPDGRISLPLLNDVQAAGLTPSQLAEQITTSLKKFVTDPQVTVIVSAINSQRVYILGEVTRPGAYPMLPGMNVLQGLSSAGGFTQFAKTKSIYVLRMEDGKQQKYPVNYKEVISGKRPEQNISLKAGDTIVVP